MLGIVEHCHNAPHLSPRPHASSLAELLTIPRTEPSQLNVLVAMSQGSANKIALQLWLGGLPRPARKCRGRCTDL